MIWTMNAETNLEDSRISCWDRNLEHPQIYGNPNLPIEIQQSIQKNTLEELVFTYISPLKLFEKHCGMISPFGIEK